MISNLKHSKIEGDPVNVIYYKDYEIGIWMDDYGQQFYTFIDDMEYGFGCYNFNYEDEIKYIIDRKEK